MHGYFSWLISGLINTNTSRNTGETSAGKSSIINLILGEDLLPYSVLSTTSTICELKYGERPAIRVHLKEGNSEKYEPIYQELGQASATYKEEIEGFVNLKDEREKGSPYKKIELFWPHPLFQVIIHGFKFTITC